MNRRLLTKPAATSVLSKMNRFYTGGLTTGFLILIASGLFAQPSPSIYKAWESGFTKSLKNTHDMALPAWGPYSDKYNGLSHVPALD